MHYSIMTIKAGHQASLYSHAIFFFFLLLKRIKQGYKYKYFVTRDWSLSKYWLVRLDLSKTQQTTFWNTILLFFS